MSEFNASSTSCTVLSSKLRSASSPCKSACRVRSPSPSKSEPVLASSIHSACSGLGRHGATRHRRLSSRPFHWVVGIFCEYSIASPRCFCCREKQCLASYPAPLLPESTPRGMDCTRASGSSSRVGRCAPLPPIARGGIEGARSSGMPAEKRSIHGQDDLAQTVMAFRSVCGLMK